MMSVTQRTQFALKTLLDVAFHEKSGPVQRRHIALRQSVPTDYLDGILTKLRDSHMIQSLRGREGGYHLAKHPADITLWDIVEAVEEMPHTLKSTPQKRPELSYASDHLTEPAIGDVFMLLRRDMRKCTLEMFLDDAEDRMLEAGLDPVELSENLPEEEKGKKKITRSYQEYERESYSL